MSDTRQHAHELIDKLPHTQLIAVTGLLEAVLELVPVVIGAAPVDDEPATSEDQRRLREGQAWFAQRDGKGIPMDEVLAALPDWLARWSQSDIRALDQPTDMRMFENILGFARSGNGNVVALQSEFAGWLRLRAGDYR
jgi:hypothetical protein